MTIYTTRYQARKNASGAEKVIKVCGGYIIMTYQDYRIWKSQK